jgi:hypothetical protein
MALVKLRSSIPENSTWGNPGFRIIESIKVHKIRLGFLREVVF